VALGNKKHEPESSFFLAFGGRSQDRTGSSRFCRPLRSHFAMRPYKNGIRLADTVVIDKLLVAC
jgi:hypothetical protein